MIIRVFRARVFEGKQREFERFIVEKAIPILEGQSGLVSVTVGMPRTDTPNDFLMTTTWRDIDALKGFTGESWQNPVIDPDEADLLSDVFVDHYEKAEL